LNSACKKLSRELISTSVLIAEFILLMDEGQARFLLHTSRDVHLRIIMHSRIIPNPKLLKWPYLLQQLPNAIVYFAVDCFVNVETCAP